MTAQSRLQGKLIELLDCLSSVDSLVNCHVANFFTKNLWDDILPPSVTQELENIGKLSEFTPRYLKYLSDGKSLWSMSCPNLDKFLNASKNIEIRNDSNCVTSLQCLKTKICCTDKIQRITLKDFMSVKKKHEVLEMVPLADGLTKLTGTDHLLDIGSGKGYLSSCLALYCGLQVLSLDASTTSTCGAAKLEAKIAKKIDVPSVGSCKREAALISSRTALEPLLDRHFGYNRRGIGMLGLHTCGGLASTCCKLFVEQDVRWLVNVGCCYHLIEEEFEKNSFWRSMDINEESLFPLSDFLLKKKIRLGRNARMLAAHSQDKLQLHGLKREAMKSLFYRAVLQVVIERARGHNSQGQVGRLYKKCADFHQYIRLAVEKLGLNINVSEGHIDELLANYENQQRKLEVFFLLRTHFAPLVESIILLDRLLFLIEQGITNAHLVPLFDPRLSPRHYAIVAWKTSCDM